MSRDDAWARLTPYEVGIPGRRFAEARFGAIAEEAATRELDPSDPGVFLLLGATGRTIREIQGEERGGEAIQRFGAFLFHAFHFHAAGELVLLTEVGAVRHLAEEEPPSDAPWRGELPADAGYIQLPRHLVWAHPEPDGPPEDLDGIFWARAAGDRLSLLAALGMRDDRPGLSLVPLSPAPIADAPAWSVARCREEGEDFRTTLPGGEIGRLYSVVTAGEILKLVSRLFMYLNARPEALGAQESPPRPAEGGEGRVPRPSFLPFRRIWGPDGA